ncbi:threonine/homoserine exporter RhtA [Bordetella genomosp. 5]|uniref:Threonine/homoserine exporter RhtA n=1 Tax=Bordetella genomosp. 5 TaxID=1395608 RepID=A0A261T801_9BORD|nr:threonine/homoserine exporter RhtA [Bordetella genomosp. 5]OZI45744.1 threonine/homoserine exporter RhtA [Bordetella genomosp. 5]OZI46131.1 threonine/homoserine exporter RhtA [Bordetella genomosp. 5]
MSAPDRPASPVVPVLLLLIAMASLQGGASLAKSLFPAVGAQGTAALRLLFSALILLPILQPWRLRLPAEGWRIVALYGLTLGGMNLMFYMSISTIPLGIAVALEFTGPLAVAVFTSRRLLDFAWIGLAAIGLVVLIPHGDDLAALDPVGVAYALGAGVCWALYIVFGQRAGLRYGPRTVALAAAFAALAVLPFGIASAGSALFSAQLLPAAVAVAVLSSALPYALEVVVLTRLPARTFGTLLSLEPVFGAISGLLFLGEALSLTQWGAVAAIVTASAGITLTASRGKR